MLPVQPITCFPTHPRPTEPARPMTTLEKVMSMPGDMLAVALAKEHGMDINTVSWEDTARNKGSCWGPNISDMTLQVKDAEGKYQRMPVIRQPNFQDKTQDIPLDSIKIKVGNECGAETLTSMTLRQFLENITKYVQDGTITGSMLAETDTHAIHSVQACFLPAEQRKEVNFNVALFNYQSRADDPAVMTIVVSGHGASVQTIDKADGWKGQKLMFNKNGRACDFVAERLKDVRAQQGTVVEGAMSDKEDENRRLYIIQIPLKTKPRPESFGMPEGAMCCFAAMPAACAMGGVRMKSANMDHAQIKIGQDMGPFEGLHKHTIERDTRFPIRVTEQLYKLINCADINREEMEAVAKDIKESEMKGKNASSLVLEDTKRPTEWVKV